MTARRFAVLFFGALLVLSAGSVAQAERDVSTYGQKPTARAAAKPTADARKAEQTKAKPAAQQRRPAAPPPPVSEVIASGNNGELRSEQREQTVSLFGGIFGGTPQRSNLLPQTQALDSVLEERNRKGRFQVKSEFEPQTVAFTGYPSGTIVINTRERYLYLVESPNSARRYAIAVGRDGLEFKGSAVVGDKQEWPRWIPTLDMQKREPRKYGQYKDGMPGGADNPLGARAIYLYQGNKDTHIRIHGTNQPQTIGTNSSNGCFRMVNDHVIDLYGRVRMGTQVVVL
jgi:lipoprotein-anchoring transpeptidase ErfK/SrfK